jgi:two-component system, sensor histidine kinase and response regulator
MNDIVSPQIIMFVDDEPENLKILEALFAHTHYLMRFFTSGEQALAAAQEEKPDLVLLDVRMPKMDGYEVCRRFKADERLRAIPILFLSAGTSTEEITQGFDQGAVDYITKPFREAEILARVRNHLALSNAYATLAQQHTYLQELERQRDTYVHMLVHDMRSPLMAMLGHLQLIEACGAKQLAEEDLSSLQAVIHCTRTLSRMTSTVVDLSRMEHAQLTLDFQSITIRELFQSARDQVVDRLSARRITEQIKEGCPSVVCDCELSVRIAANLLANAIKYSPEASDIVIGAEPDPSGGVRLWIKDQGPGIRVDEHSKIFEKFKVGSHVKQMGTSSTGIGLAFCKMAAEAQGGKVGVESEPGCGSLFWFTLPGAALNAQNKRV